MPTSPNSDIATDGIRIQAAAQYQPPQSDPGVDRYVYKYEITMSNEGQQKVRLLARHWIIVDSEGRREDVRGPGVVGNYPSLAPGESYRYGSHCPLKTPWGTMEGAYTFERDDGTRFEVSIGRFFLVPSAVALSL